MRVKGWRVMLLGAAIVAVAAWGVTAAFGEDDTVTWTEAVVRDLVVGVEVEGTLASRDSTIVTPPSLPDVFEFSIAFMAPEGQNVEAGDPVLGFDATQLEQQLLEQQTTMEQAIKNIEKLDVDQEQQMLQLQRCHAGTG